MHDTMESPANHCCCVTFLSGCHPQRGEKLSSCEFLLVTGSPIQQGGPAKSQENKWGEIALTIVGGPPCRVKVWHIYRYLRFWLIKLTYDLYRSIVLVGPEISQKAGDCQISKLHVTCWRKKQEKNKLPWSSGKKKRCCDPILKMNQAS